MISPRSAHAYINGLRISYYEIANKREFWDRAWRYVIEATPTTTPLLEKIKDPSWQGH